MLTVETGVRAWKPILVPVISMNVESTEAVHTLELFEAVKWHLTGPCDEL